MNQYHSITDSCTHMSCSDVEELLPLIAEGLIDADSDNEVFAHLAECDSCSDSLALQDIITLSLGIDVEMSQSPRNEVIYFPIPRIALSAAAIFLVACTAFIGYRTSNTSTDLTDNHELAAQTNLPETEILKVLPAQNGDDQPMILIRHQGQTMLIRQDQIDSGTNNTDVNANVPVVVSVNSH